MVTAVERKGYKMYVGGEWVGGSAGAFDNMNPASGDVWQQIPNSSADDARRAIGAAAAAAKSWAATPHPERASYLLKAADILEKRKGEVADILIDEAGSWIGKAMFEIGYVTGLLRSAAAMAYSPTGEILPSDHGKLMMVERVPLGVVSVISPWNFPLLLSSRGISIPMAVGNTVVLKPSEETPVAGGLLIAEIFEEAGLPKGVLNVITCSRNDVQAVGEVLVTDPRVGGISFTGSTAVGRQIARDGAYNLKRIAMELGGKDALIILDDADLERAVDAATFGTFMHQGQICMSTERIIVDASLADAFTEKFVERVKGLGIGNTRELGCPIGPIINQKQLDKIHGQVTEAINAGATLLTGGKHDGLFYHPTVLANVKRDMRVWREETFGPVAPIVVVNGEDEAVEVANDCEYGLSAGVITASEERGMSVVHRLETGIAHVNDQSVYDEPHVPFGGVKNSGIGRHGGRASVETFTETRWLTIERGGRHYPPPFLAKGH